MTKVIENIELLKKLAPYLEDMETEYCLYREDKSEKYEIETFFDYMEEIQLPQDTFYKTLILEEAIELLPYEINGYTLEFYKCMNGGFNCAYIKNPVNADIIIDRLTMWSGDNMLNSIDNMLECLIDNNLLPKE